MQRDIGEAAEALAAWGGRSSGSLTGSDWQNANRALAAIDRLADTLGHVRSGLVREMDSEAAYVSPAGGDRS